MFVFQGVLEEFLLVELYCIVARCQGFWGGFFFWLKCHYHLITSVDVLASLEASLEEFTHNIFPWDIIETWEARKAGDCLIE